MCSTAAAMFGCGNASTPPALMSSQYIFSIVATASALICLTLLLSISLVRPSRDSSGSFCPVLVDMSANSESILPSSLKKEPINVPEERGPSADANHEDG